MFIDGESSRNQIRQKEGEALPENTVSHGHRGKPPVRACLHSLKVTYQVQGQPGLHETYYLTIFSRTGKLHIGYNLLISSDPFSVQMKNQGPEEET